MKKYSGQERRMNELFFNHHLSKSMITKKKVSPNFAPEWKKIPLAQRFHQKDSHLFGLEGRRRRW
jgi:hypothetical protein